MNAYLLVFECIDAAETIQILGQSVELAFRDLGGMVTTDGRKVRDGILFRSDRLSSLSERDIEKLTAVHLCCAYDLRNTREQKENPDAKIPGCEYISLPVFPERVEGITREEQTLLEEYIELVGSMMENKKISAIRMVEGYRTFVRSEHCRAQFHFFLEDLLAREKEARKKKEKKAYLWHCAGGKDRTGFVSVILEEIFGMAKEDIIDDYMLTNRYVDFRLTDLSLQLYERLQEYYGEQIEEITEMIREPIDDMTHARREYLDASYDEVEKLYGNFTDFIVEGLDFSLEKQEELRKLFLE